MARKLFFFYYIIFILSLIKNITTEQILFAFQMNRHGARAPYFGVTNGTDVYKEKWNIIEELSEVGRRMLYLLGVKARKRYINEYNLLSEKYNPQEIYIRSTDSNRTIESIYSFLQGLYPNGTGQTINDKVLRNTNITYPPNQKYKDDFEYILNEYNMNDNGASLPYQMSIEPIHLFYGHENELYDADYCLGLKNDYEKRQRRTEIFNFADKIMNETNNLFMELEETDNKTFLYDYWTLYKYMDGFLCDDTDVRRFDYMKSHYSDEIVDQLRGYSKEFIDMDYFGTNFPESANKTGIVAQSYTLHSLINWMNQAINNYEKKNNQYIKFVVYSGHDSTIGSMENFLRYAFNNIKLESCSFSDSRYFELYVDDKNKYKVRFLKGDNTVKMDIDYETFKNTINEKTWDDEKVNEFCQLVDKKENIQENILGISIMIALIIFNLILITFLVFISCRKIKKSD